MRVDFGFFCEEAVFDEARRIRSVTGILNSIHTHEFPALYPRLYYVLGVKAHDSDTGRRSISLRLVDPEGKPLAPTMVFQVEFSPRVMYFHTISEIQDLVFQKPGLYAMEVSVSGRMLRSDDLHIEKGQQ